MDGLPVQTMTEAEPPANLHTLPIEILVLIGENILNEHRPLRLANYALIHRSIDKALDAPEADNLWKLACAMYPKLWMEQRRRELDREQVQQFKALGLTVQLLLPAGDVPFTRRALFATHAKTFCHDCHQPTPYKFELTNRRLCTKCERASPHLYGLATVEQLVHERSVVQQLTQSQRRDIFRRLPSVERGSHRWYLRHEAIAEAQALLEPAEEEEETAVEVSDETPAVVVSEEEPSVKDEGSESAVSAPIAIAGGGRAQEEDEEDEDPCSCSPLEAADVCSEWEAAAALHRAKRAPGVEAAKRARDEKKMHKRKVKAEQREKREKATVGAMPAGFVMRGSPPSSSSSPHHHHSHSHKAKRPTHSKHRQERSSGEWEAALERLEAEFGEDLCGLSGLCLVPS